MVSLGWKWDENDTQFSHNSCNHNNKEMEVSIEFPILVDHFSLFMCFIFFCARLRDFLLIFALIHAPIIRLEQSLTFFSHSCWPDYRRRSLLLQIMRIWSNAFSNNGQTTQKYVGIEVHPFSVEHWRNFVMSLSASHVPYLNSILTETVIFSKLWHFQHGLSNR